MTVTIYGADWCPDYRRSRALLQARSVDHVHVDTDTEDGARRAREISGASRIPVVVLEDGSHLVEPSDEELASRLGV
ncbi:glutaredoxin family protein [Solicola sp. PLA-1-18]|uniref:glutaredoxin family protein n=1 Tax=Solicola sp. PLA-1-18 TaxID=3380532 RepID=UPI003B791EBB